MADTEADLVQMPQRRQLPDRIVISEDVSEGLTPYELSQIKKASGVRLDYLMEGDADLDEKATLGVYIALMREGYEPTWEEARHVRPVSAPAEPPDPTKSGR